MSGYRIHRQVTEFGEHVRGWRMVLGLTAQQVSERAGITRDTLRKIESGNPNVSFNSVTQVLRALGILDQLVDAADPLASDIGRLRAGASPERAPDDHYRDRLRCQLLPPLDRPSARHPIARPGLHHLSLRPHLPRRM